VEANGSPLSDPSIIGTVFGLVFLAELPDKTAVASLLLGAKFPARWVFAGVGAAFAAHVVLAVAAGSLLTLLPRRPVEAIVAVLFLLGAVLVWREGSEDPEETKVTEEQEQALVEDPATPDFWRVAGRGFAIIFVAEWGDLTQILTANLAAKYDNALAVGIGAVLGLWAVGLLAILGGKTLLRVIPIRLLTRIAALAMAVLAVISMVNALGG
jgi:putative Ca2+/H+ antiporter (TMEM165/GDT1 family)